jgi:hypothetical protein
VEKRNSRKGYNSGMKLMTAHSGISRSVCLCPAELMFTLLRACAPRSSTSAPTATPDAYRALPAAGICASFPEETVRVTIRAWPDNIPDPRCIRVRAGQTLTILYQSGEPIEFRLGRFQDVIPPAGSHSIDIPFGDYLAPGAHSLHIEPFGGPEIFFESAKDSKKNLKDAD